MRWVFWILSLFALAVAVALALRSSPGYALLVWPPYRVELSINLLVLLLVAGFAVGYLVLRFVLGAIALPARVRAYRERRRRDNARASLISAIRAFLFGRYGKAEQAAVVAMKSSESPALAAVIAARAAHELRQWDKRDGYLEQAESIAPADTALRAVTSADVMLDERRFDDALAELKTLPAKHTAALRLELKAQQLAKNWDSTFPLVEQLERRGVFDGNQARQLRRYAYMENLQRKSLDRRSMGECWQKIPAEYRRDAKVAAAGAQGFIALGDGVKACEIIEDALDAEWDSELVGLYAECANEDTVRQIERAELWLTTNPGDAVLLFTLGKLCARQELWGKAQSYLEASISVDPMYSAHLTLAELHERLGNSDAARRHYRESLELAVDQLRKSSGGRRRTPL